MRARLLFLAALGGCVWPALALGKAGAAFSPQLVALPAGRPARVQVYVLSDPGRRDRTPDAPRAGTVPVLVVRLLPSGRRLRFRGTPLDRHHRCTVSIVLPASAASQTWKASVRADGRVYRDTIDGGPVTVASAAATGTPSVSRRPAARPRRSTSRTPAVVGGVLVATAAAAAGMRRARGHSRPVPER